MTTGPTSTLGVMRDLVLTYAAASEVRTVAVVANAPSSPSIARAEAIDSSDVVFRCNSFVIDETGQAPAHGRKVHVVVFNRALRASPRFFHRYRERLYLMVEPGRLHWEPDVRPNWWPEDLGILPVPNREIMLTLAGVLDLPSRAQPIWPTTGLLSAWIARLLFPEAELRLAGFSMVDDREQTEWEHAWGDSCPVGREHRIGPEGELLHQWISSGQARWLS
jgi:hypothetical protein